MNTAAFRPYAILIDIWADGKQNGDPPLRFSTPEDDSGLTEFGCIWEESGYRTENYGTGSTTPPRACGSFFVEFRSLALSSLVALTGRMLDLFVVRSVSEHADMPVDLYSTLYVESVQYTEAGVKESDGSRIYVSRSEFSIQTNRR